MTREEKAAVVEDLKVKFDNAQYFYVTDSSSMTVAAINKLRRICYDKNIQVHVVKNTLAIKAMESAAPEKGYSQVYEALKGPSTILFSDTGNLPAKVLEEFRKSSPRPLLKAAYIDSDVFFGDDQIAVLAKLKSKDELVGDIIGLLQSPAKNVISGLKSGGSKIAGILKTLEDRG
jgi:large subunit ribosomal protein L10